MANEINTNHNPVLLNKAPKQAGKPGGVEGGSARQETGSGPASVGDKVSFTADATRLQHIQEQLSAVPDINSAKVAEIKAAIADGTFTVDPQAIASKLIAFETGK